MNIEDIIPKLKELEARVEAKGYTRPCFKHSLDTDNWQCISSVAYIPAEFLVEGVDQLSSISIHVSSFDGFDSVYSAAQAKIANLPNVSQKARIEFQERLGNLIDYARKIGIEDSFVNPIADLAQELAENAITYQA